MYIIKVGMNYKNAPIEIREKITFSDKAIEEAMLHLGRQQSILENVIFSTCNRTEIYVVVDEICRGKYEVNQFLANWFQIETHVLLPYLQLAENERAIEHLFRVTVGLDSMVLGETQILGQVRDAFLTAQKLNTTRTIFNELFKQAITIAKRAHKDTAIGEHAVSISYAAVALAKKVFGTIKNKHVVVLGAGEMAELAVRNLYGAGATNITIINRTFENATALAKNFNAKSVPFAHLLEELKHADVLISSTASASPLLSKKELAPIQKQRKGNPLFLVDIAVPRDLDSAISDLESVFLYDIDDLQDVVDKNLEARKKAAVSIESMLEGEILEFINWVATLGVVPVISSLREKALTIQSETMASLTRKMPDLSAREKKVLDKHTKSIVNQLLKDPIKHAKKLAQTDKATESLGVFVDIFGMEEAVKTKMINKIEENESLTKGSQKGENKSFPLIDQIIPN